MNTKHQYQYQDRYASYVLTIENNIICAVVQGAIGESFARRYNQDFCKLITVLNLQSWGHYADFSQCEAMTKEAQQKSVELHAVAKQMGCVVSAYQMNSSLLTNQVNTIRKASDIALPIKQKIFDTKAQCLAYIEKHLAGIKQV